LVRIVVGVHRKEDDRGVGALPAEGGGDLETGYTGELDIHHDQGRLVNVGLVEGVVAVRGFGHHLQSRVLIQDAAQTAPEKRMVVDNHDPAFEHCGVSSDLSTIRPPTMTRRLG
jgi:hypothetical protein